MRKKSFIFLIFFHQVSVVSFLQSSEKRKQPQKGQSTSVFHSLSRSSASGTCPEIS